MVTSTPRKGGPLMGKKNSGWGLSSITNTLSSAVNGHSNGHKVSEAEKEAFVPATTGDVFSGGRCGSHLHNMVIRLPSMLLHIGVRLVDDQTSVVTRRAFAHRACMLQMRLHPDCCRGATVQSWPRAPFLSLLALAS